jgi:ADP-dependent NAD(P)H-hydrate dehydratase / NAD(P)H-hydrate epimerase
MIRILNTKQIRALDAHTILHEPVPSIDLMERACRAFVSWFVQRIDATKKIGIVCGTGNNGGDGLGIARMLHDWGYPVKVWVVRGAVPETADFKKNLERIKDRPEISEIVTASDQGLFRDRDIMIDAIFGSGLSRPAEGIYAQAIRCMNETNAVRIAIDVPSGLSADQPSAGEIVKAHYTVSFQLPKLAFFLPGSHPFTGEWVTVDIGLNKNFIRESETSHFQVTRKDAARIIRPRKKFDHKGTFGHALIIAGSYGKIGAAVLASRAVLRSGAGLLSVHVPACGYSILQTALPEAMVSTDAHEHFFTKAPALEKYSTIGIGPGIGQEPATVKALAEVLENFRKPVVIDADGLNILGANPALMKLIPENSVLTPHPKEFERLVGKWENDFIRLEKQKHLAAQLKCVIALKGAYSSIATPEGKVYFNSTGNPGMAKGGSGDVLTGILTALLAQGYSAEETAILGVYLHGLAGDIGSQEKGTYALIATDLVEFLPQSFKSIVNKF